MNLLEPKNYKVALKVFDNICEEWKLSEEDKAFLNVSRIPNDTSLIAISRVFSIYKSLQILFERNSQAATWVHKDNSIFNSSAIHQMRTPKGLEKIQNYLNSEIELIGG